MVNIYCILKYILYIFIDGNMFNLDGYFGWNRNIWDI